MDINYIASIITDDPDVLNEEALPNIGNNAGTPPIPGADKSLTSAEINQKAHDLTNNDASKEIETQLKTQEDIKKAEEDQNQRIIQPQFQRLQQSLNKLNTGVHQGRQATITGGEQFNNLDKEMANIRTLLTSLGKNFA